MYKLFMKSLDQTSYGNETSEGTILRSLSFAETINIDEIDDIDIKDLILKERSVPVVIGVDESIRPKIIDSCGMTCNFCHNEGTPVASAYDKITLLPNPQYRGAGICL